MDTFFLGPSELWITLARFVRSVLYEKNFSVRNLFSFHFVRTGIGTWIPSLNLNRLSAIRTFKKLQ